MESNAELWTVKDLAAMLQLGERTVWRMAWRKAPPLPIRLGRSVRWRRTTIERWIAEQEGARGASGREKS